MKEKLREKKAIIREVAKNVIMGNRFLKGLRNKINSGRTTGALDVDKAFKHSLSIFEHYKLGLKEAGLDDHYFEGKTLLEIGPGANLGVELSFIGDGVAEVYALDRFTDVQSTSKEAALYERIIAQLSEEQRKKITGVYKTENNLPVFIGDKINYLGNCSLEDVLAKFTDEDGGINLKVDVIVSHLALEHVANLSKGIYSVARLLKPGGICIFICNLKSLGGVYKHEDEPLRLLYYSEKLWQRMFSKRGGSNRVRANGYKKQLEVNNLSVLSFNVLERMPLPELKKIKRLFDDQFKNLTNEELSILKFRLVAQMPK